MKNTISSYLGAERIEVRTYSSLIRLTQCAGSMEFNFEMMPVEARELAEILVKQADFVEELEAMQTKIEDEHDTGLDSVGDGSPGEYRGEETA